MKSLYWFLLGCCCSITGCQDSKESRFTVVATTSMICDAVKNIVKDHASLITLMGPGVDPHTYKASQRDVQRITKSPCGLL